jgi:membrane protein
MLRTAFGLLKETASQWVDDKASSRGAALAYYSMFAIAPIIIFAVLLAGLVYGPDAAQGKVAQQLQGIVGRPMADATEKLVLSASNPTSSKIAALIGLAVALFGAATLFGELQDALNTIWKVVPRPGRPIVGIIRDRAFSFAMVLSAGLLLIASLVVTTVLNAAARYFDPSSLPGGVALWQALNWLVSFAFITLLFALIFKVVPDVHVPWRDVWVGAALTGVLFTLGKYLLALYMTHTGVTSAYGAAGSLAAALVWVYYSAQILLFGAEFTRAQARRQGAECPPARSAVPLAEDEPPRPQDPPHRNNSPGPSVPSAGGNACGRAPQSLE